MALIIEFLTIDTSLNCVLGSVLLFIEQVISGLDKAAATMKRGEKAVLTVNPEYGFGNVEVQRDLAKVPQCSILIYEIEMLDFVKVIENTGI